MGIYQIWHLLVILSHTSIKITVMNIMVFLTLLVQMFMHQIHTGVMEVLAMIAVLWLILRLLLLHCFLQPTVFFLQMPQNLFLDSLNK